MQKEEDQQLHGSVGKVIFLSERNFFVGTVFFCQKGIFVVGKVFFVAWYDDHGGGLLGERFVIILF